MLHAYFPDHAYPKHTHDTWTLLVVDSGTVCFDLERSQHATERSRVTLLPPHVAHDGRTVRLRPLEGGFLEAMVTEPDGRGPVDGVLRPSVGGG